MMLEEVLVQHGRNKRWQLCALRIYLGSLHIDRELVGDLDAPWRPWRSLLVTLNGLLHLDMQLL